MFDYKGWRKDKGLTQEQAAEQSGMSKSSWGRLERGQAVPEAFRIAADALVKGEVTVVINSRPDAAVAPAEITVVTLTNPHHDSVSVVAADNPPAAFDAGSIRRRITKGVVWFHLGDVCQLIDYENPAHAQRLIEPDDLQKCMAPDALGREQLAWFVNEAGLNQFLLCSNVPKARPFRKWVTAEVIPTIRQTGSYAVAPTPSDSLGQHIASIADLIGFVGQSQKLLEQQVSQQQAQIAEVKEAVQGIEARTEQIAADAVKSHLAAAEEARMVIGSKRNYIERTVRHLGKMIADKVPALPDKKEEQNRRRSIFKNVWASVHLHAYVSKFDHVQTEIQCDRAIACLHQIANNQALVLPAYQAPMVGVAS